MALKIFFVFSNMDICIDPIDCTISTTVAEISHFINQITSWDQEVVLSLDGCTILPCDATPMEQVISGGEITMFVRLEDPLLILNVFFDGQQAQQKEIKTNITIEEVFNTYKKFVNQLFDEIQEKYKIKEYQLLDEFGFFIQKIPDIKENFFYYVQDKKKVILNLIRGEKIQEEQKIDVFKTADREQTSISYYKDPLAQLVVFKNFTLLIDPLGNFVAYKFHHPLIMEGKLKKSLGKPMNLGQLKWIQNNKVKYAKINDFGLGIQWDNDTYSSFQLQ